MGKKRVSPYSRLSNDEARFPPAERRMTVFYVLSDASYIGSDECAYEACDDEENCDTAVIVFTINEDRG